MDGPPLPKRKRIVTACIECHRRKQKCDYARPCSNCVARGVSGKCIYDEREDLRSRDGAFESSEQREQHSPDFISQAGYSLSSDNNTYTTLQKSLLADPPPTKHAITAPPRDTQTKDKFRQVLDQLPSKAVTKDLVENYFVEANWYFLVLEHFHFNQLHKSWLDNKDKGINQVSLQIQHFIPLLFQVLAVYLQFLQLDSACAKALVLVYKQL